MFEAANCYGIASHCMVHIGKDLSLQKYSLKKRNQMEHSAPQDNNNFYAVPPNTLQ